MQNPVRPEIGIFQPTWGRGIFAASLAIAGFLLPQEVPLEWYPLNEPGTDINYLEITCAADITSETQLYPDYGRGFNELDSIRIPISPSKQAYTYTFPLQDAPLIGLRVDPYKATGELLITNLRIINRRNEEIRRFVREDFALSNHLAAITPTPEGWKLVTVPAAWDPYSVVEFPAPLIPVGMNHRNLLRCLLSTGYLAGMLLILLLAVLFTFYRPTSWSDFFKHLGFMACLGLLFSTVGNRGLIRNSLHYSRYLPPALTAGFWLEIDLVTSKPSNTQLFWDTGEGITEKDSVHVATEAHQGLQTLRYPFPNKTLLALRFDPCDAETQIDIHHVRIVDGGKRTQLVLPLDSIQTVQQISELKIIEETLHLHTLPEGHNPITAFSKQAVIEINRVFSQTK